VTVHYDPLLAKLIAHGANRDEALARTRDALERFEVLGLRHNIGFLLGLLDRPEVKAAECHTTFIEEHLEALSAGASDEVRRAAAAIAAFVAADEPQSAATPEQADAGARPRPADPWDTLGQVEW
jgi:acetyl/propionyl-CoA carboxylase alpha subunit